MTSSGVELVARLVLDTSAYSHFRRGHEIVLDFMASAGIIFLSTTVLGELEAGFEGQVLTLIAKSSKHENAKQPHWAQARSSCWGTRSPPL